MARFLEARGMIEEALEVATDLDYRFDLAIQLGRLEIAKVRLTFYFFYLYHNNNNNNIIIIILKLFI